MLSPTLLPGIEWIIHKYDHTLSLFGKALDCEVCCVFCGAEEALRTGMPAQQRGQADGSHCGIRWDRQVMLPNTQSPSLNSLEPHYFSFLLHVHYSSVQGPASCYSHQRALARKCPGLWLQENSNMVSPMLACKAFRLQ